MNTAYTSPKKHAIVAGGSLAGLLAAKVLSKHYSSVTIIEKDSVQRKPEARKGQAQAYHLHALLPAGLQVLSHYFPGFLDDLSSHGVKVLDFASSMNWYCYGGFRKRFPIGIEVIIVSRALLEHVVRERILAMPNIQLVDNTLVKQLTTTDDKQSITGIVTENKNTGQTNLVSADFVMDTSGRGSRTAQWLKELGYGETPVSEVKVNVGYTTRIYTRDPGDAHGESWIISTPIAPGHKRFGAAFPIENNRWMVTVGGWHNDHAPTLETEYLEFVRGLPNPALYDVVSTNKAVGDFIQYKFPFSLRRHYEKLRRFPVGFLVAGDAFSSFNPIYGQGMSSAALQVELLDKLLNEQVPDQDLAKTFFKRSTSIIDVIWSMATGEDFRYPQTSGTRPPGIKLVNKYIEQVHKATTKDEVVCGAFLKVIALLKPPTHLFQPAILWRVLRQGKPK
ncbi:FAD-dependent monooxygenase [Segetibacter sp. 3557_3]|uniref:FAD-dependent oxidoreductase n=1 Tax=Segetibacter sp. 3557_3 TaxID=2547429 RepID=UPI00105873D9|nr:FAD-dependent monooxygenase [Segetibacter sp. 3557_3]TDH26990.1 FAD-dependent monooxygenase [Segetibacter sp. 3557_3]